MSLHTYGNIKMYLGPTEIDHYSAGLRTLLESIFPATSVLWIIRVALIAALALHGSLTRTGSSDPAENIVRLPVCFPASAASVADCAVTRRV